MSEGKTSERVGVASTPVRFRTRDLIVMHLCEAARLGAQIKEQIDIKLFNHLVGMAVYAAQEGDEEVGCEPRLHS